jgi:5'-nucleotidase
MLKHQFDPRVQVLKIEVPAQATPQTPWELVRLSLKRYYHPVRPARGSWDTPTLIGYRLADDLSSFQPGTDTHSVLVEKKVAVTPLSLDMTANVSFEELEAQMRGE